MSVSVTSLTYVILESQFYWINVFLDVSWKTTFTLLFKAIFTAKSAIQWFLSPHEGFLSQVRVTHFHFTQFEKDISCPKS